MHLKTYPFWFPIIPPPAERAVWTLQHWLWAGLFLLSLLGSWNLKLCNEVHANSVLLFFLFCFLMSSWWIGSTVLKWLLFISGNMLWNSFWNSSHSFVCLFVRSFYCFLCVSVSPLMSTCLVFDRKSDVILYPVCKFFVHLDCLEDFQMPF